MLIALAGAAAILVVLAIVAAYLYKNRSVATPPVAPTPTVAPPVASLPDQRDPVSSPVPPVTPPVVKPPVVVPVATPPVITPPSLKPPVIPQIKLPTVPPYSLPPFKTIAVPPTRVPTPLPPIRPPVLPPFKPVPVLVSPVKKPPGKPAPVKPPVKKPPVVKPPVKKPPVVKPPVKKPPVKPPVKKPPVVKPPVKKPPVKKPPAKIPAFRRQPGCTNLWGGNEAKDVPGGINRKDVRATFHFYAPGYETSSLACADRFWADKDHGKKLMKYPWTANCLDGRKFSQESCGKCLRVTNRRTGASVIVRSVDNGGCSDKDGTGLDMDPCGFNQIDSDRKGLADGHMRVDVREVDCGADGTIGKPAPPKTPPKQTPKPVTPLVPTKPKPAPVPTKKPSVGSDGWWWKTSDLPRPSSNDYWCKTYMSSSTDDGSCFALVYHHRVDGRKDKSKVPTAISKNMGSVMKQLYDVPCKHETAAGKEYKCFSKTPKEWTSVCVARPDLAGRGKCAGVSKNEWRFFTPGDDATRKSTCQYPSLYIKAHAIEGKVQTRYVGRVGRG